MCAPVFARDAPMDCQALPRGAVWFLSLPPAVIVLHGLSVSTSFVLAALWALHVDSFLRSAGAGRDGRRDGVEQGGVDLAGDVAFEAADDLFSGHAFFGAACGVGAGAGVPAQPAEHDPVERAV